jgi:MoxR-like ATPase
MFMIGVDYPSRDEEIAIARTTTGQSLPKLEHIMDGAKVLRVPRPRPPRSRCRITSMNSPSISPKDPSREQRGSRMAQAPRRAGEPAPCRAVFDPRCQSARAALNGSYMVRQEDLIAIASPVLRHRLIKTFTAESEGITARSVISRLVEEATKEG